jgi:ATP-dependent DNA ligase
MVASWIRRQYRVTPGRAQARRLLPVLKVISRNRVDTIKLWTMPGNGKISISFTPPMECLPVPRMPEGDIWVYELKLDGYRAQAIRDRAGTRLLSRNDRGTGNG